jgi:hypothetical protein
LRFSSSLSQTRDMEKIAIRVCNLCNRWTEHGSC